MPVNVQLVCDECGARDHWRPFLRLSRIGTLRLEGGTSFYVDGGRCLCPKHRTLDLLSSSAQRVTWNEADRFHFLSEAGVDV